MAKFYTDGGVKNNGKFGKQEAHICCVNEKGKVIFLEPMGDKTNNEAELMAILKLLKKTRTKNFIVSSDSQLAVNLINKKWKTQILRLHLILEDIWKIKKQFSLIWEPRELNRAGWHIEEKFGL